MKPMDKHYCPICGNVVVESTSVCLHCAAPIDRPQPYKPRASGCLSALVLIVALGLAESLLARAALLRFL